MAQVTVTINSRAYQVACEDGQEAHLQKLAAYLDQKVTDLVKKVGQVGDARLMLMASLLLADELADAYDELQEFRAAAATAAVTQGSSADGAKVDEEIAASIGVLAAKISALAERIEDKRA